MDSSGFKVNEDKTLEFPFSSEYPVERYFGMEILSHDKGAVDLNRDNGGMPVLFNHNPDALIGVVEKITLGTDKRLYAKVKMSETGLGAEKLKQIDEGILKNVSFGYQIKDMKETKRGSGNVPSEFTVTNFEIFEISFVTIPADSSVGLGRGDEQIENEVNVETIKTTEQPKKEITKMEPNIEQIRSEAAKSARETVSSIYALGEKFKDKELARQLVDKGASIEEARTAFLDKIEINQKPVTGTEGVVGLSEKEIKNFSIVRALNAMANPQDKRAQELAKFEFEASEAAQKLTGKSARGVLVPFDVLRGSQRDLTVGTNSAGGYTVATDLLASSFIDILRKKAVVLRAGAQSLSGLVGNIAIPRQSGAASAYWVAESGTPTASTVAFEQVAMSPKTVGAISQISRKLLIQSSMDVESMVRNDIAQVIALEIDRAALYGSGSSNQPSGLNIASGLNTVNFAGSQPTYAEIVSMETKIAQANADVSGMKYLINALGRGYLKTLERSATGTTGNFALMNDGLLNGYGYEVSNQLVTTSSTDPDYFFGNFNDLIIGFWSGLDVVADAITQAGQGAVKIIALQDCDIAVRHAESFCKGANNP